MRADKKTIELAIVTAFGVAAFWQPWLLIVSVIALLHWTKPTEDLSKIEELEKKLSELNQELANVRSAINVKRVLGR